MNTNRIKLWRPHYRLREPHVLAWERLASDTVLVAFDKAMAKVVPDASEVVLVRNVGLRFTAEMPNGSYLDLAEQWGRAMATAVQEAIRRNAPGNVRRFADVVEHVVCYLEAVLNEQHADAWYFARLRAVESVTTDTSLSDRGRFDILLEQYLECWPEILSRLSLLGLTLPVLRRVSVSMQRRLWSVGIRGIKSNGDHQSERPIFLAALQIVARLRGRDFAVEDREPAFLVYSSRPQPSTDWSDTTHLSEAVFAAVRFLLDKFSVSLELTTEVSSAASNPIAMAIEPLDWLDREWLQRRLVGFLTRDRHARSSTSANSSVESRPVTPMQAAWEQVWSGIESRFFSEWNSASPASEPNCLLALSLMVEQHSAWVHDPSMATFIERQLARIAKGFSQNLSDSIQSKRPRSLPQEEQSALPRTNSVRRLEDERRLGTDGHSTDTQQAFASESTIFPTEYAGAFLLARGLHDLRIAGLARQTGFPNTSPWAASTLLMHLACHWAQRDCPKEVDFGLLEFARLAGPGDWAEFTTSPDPVDETAILSFQARLARTLLGLGTWATPSQLHVTVTSDGLNENWLVGGDASGRIYPWCAPVVNSEQVGNAIALWHGELSAWSRESVNVVLDESVRLQAGVSGYPEFAGPSVRSKSLWLSDPGVDIERLRERTIQAAAASILRHWARGLRGLAASSDEFLLRQLIRRSGTISLRPRQIAIALEARPLDAAWQVSGMLDSLDFFNGKELIRISFQTKS